ncbi:MAG: ribose 5-phosphate isomerase B [Acholeplasmataceae bacterium]|nr:ribose 5-phosphate isomerase B [Acholeplasmataceae bacterium]
MKIAIGSDHGGYELKKHLMLYLDTKKISYTDFGTNSKQAVDYPDFAKKVAISVSKNEYDFGIVICGTGIGVSIAANKVKGIRAALVYNETTGRLAKQHNHANILALGGRTTSKNKAIQILEAYIKADFEDRHQPRLDKIKTMEEDSYE